MFKQFSAALLLFIALSAQAEVLSGKVVRVADGDSITVLLSGRQERVRLAAIDAPESHQAFGRKSRESLAEMVAGKTVMIDTNKRDHYQRIVGKVLLNGVDIGLEQIKRGMAWHYKHYAHEQETEDQSAYAQAEYMAQRDQLGLWRDQQPMPPWEFRKLRRSNN